MDVANEWLEAAQKQMYMEFARSNFQQEIHEMYYDLVVFGTAALFVEADQSNKGVRFSCRHIAEIYISEDAQGKVDTIYRHFTMTARAIAVRFGEENLPQKIKAEKPIPEHPLVHVIFPKIT